jgi:CRP/FNR family transcriptional regulator, cyclic AMP receptor protein
VSVQLRRGPQPLPLTLVLRQHGTLIRQGEPGDGLWLIESGALRVATISAAGHELVLDVLGPGHGAGEPTDTPSPVTVKALRPCRLSPASPGTAAELLTARAHRAADLAADFAWLDVRTRITRRLEDLAERFGCSVEGGRLLLLPLTQDEVAALAGTTRESANRALRALVADGQIRVAAPGRYVVRTRLRTVDGAPGIDGESG